MFRYTPVYLFDFDPEVHELDRLSNSVPDLIREGRLDDAERACRELKRKFPEVIDWIERSGALHEARGENETAIKYYRECIEFIDNNEGFDAEIKEEFRAAIERLRVRP